MKPLLITLRVLETIFLVGFVVTYTTAPNSESWSYSFLTILCNFSIASGVDQIVISSVIVGYVFSLIGTGLQWQTARRKLRAWSFALALLGLIACGNEIGRFLLGYDFHIWIHIPIAVLIIDWIMTREKSAVSPPEASS